MKTFRLILVPILLLVSFSLCFSIQAAEPDSGFDHFTTGFPLTGKHEFVDCSSCHLYGQFKGTPLNCWQCHDGSRAAGKHPQHVISSNLCDDCHTVYSWLGARYDHSDVLGACQNCHNNSIAIGKSPSHMTTTEICEDCHNTITFDRVARVDHAQVIGECESCHNGVTATGKSADHILTTAPCDYCHISTITWLGVIFDHSTFTGACSSCHDGVTATGQPPGHIDDEGQDCGYCHDHFAWIPAIIPPPLP